MTVFDFIITVAIGSTFGRALTAESVAIAEAIVAFVLLNCASVFGDLATNLVATFR